MNTILCKRVGWLSLLLCVALACPAWALCPVGQANKAYGEAEDAYNAAMAAREESQENEVVLTEPGDTVTAAPGQAPASGASAEDKARLDGVALDPAAWQP